jgi:hypothetical protein
MSVVNKLDRYIEWLSGGRRTGRVADACQAANLPKPVIAAQWQLDSKFNIADELLQDPSLKATIKTAIGKGVEVVTWDN